MIKYSKFLTLGITFFIILVSQVGMHGNISPAFTGLGLFSFVLIFFFLILITQGFIFKWPKIPKSLYLIFFGLIFFSSFNFIFTERLKSIIVYSSLISLFFIVRSYSIYIDDKGNFLINLVLGACLTGLLIIILGLNTPFTLFRYVGFYTNSNSMGMFAASLLHLIIGIIYSYKISFFKKIFFYILFLISVLLLLSSNSRAAILSVFIVIMFIPVIEILNGLKFKQFKIKVKFMKRFLLTLITIGLFFFIIYYLGLLDNTFEKFISKTQAQDISAGRLEGWIIMLKNWTWFGHENINNITEKKIIFGHNTWLTHLNFYGLLPTLFFLSWIVWMLNWAWKKIKVNSNTKMERVFFFTLLGYVVNATFETATSTPGLLISIVIFAIIYKKENLFSKL